MSGVRLAARTLALGFCVLTQAVCYSQDRDSSGTTLQFQTNVGSGFNCGRYGTPVYCNGIPVSIGGPGSGNGSFWLDTYVSGYRAGTGFIAWSNVSDLGQATITSSTPTLNSAGQMTKLVLNFSGTTDDGDSQTYIGSMTLTFSYYYSSGGGGRGGAGAGWRFVCTGGAVSIRYQ